VRHSETHVGVKHGGTQSNRRAVEHPLDDALSAAMLLRSSTKYAFIIISARLQSYTKTGLLYLSPYLHPTNAVISELELNLIVDFLS